MAPELIEEKPYDHTADIWSLGCIVYELLGKMREEMFIVLTTKKLKEGGGEQHIDL